MRFLRGYIYFALVGFNIFYAISYNNPVSYIAAAICFGAGLFTLLSN